MTHEDKRDLLEFIAALLLWLVCFFVPWVALFRFGPIWGIGSAVGAFGLYAWLGPRPFPGFLPGLLSMGILLGSFGCVAVAVLLKHALHRGH